jgi:hypothetical protein
LLVLPWLSPWPTADLSNAFTDHLRHAFVARVFLVRGLDVYRLPLGEAAQGVDARHPGPYWAHVPYAYPPGALILFMPLSIGSEFLVEDARLHARLLVTFTTLLAILAWLAIVWLLFSAGNRERSFETAMRVVVAAFAFGQLMHEGLDGFYDPAWVGLGAVAILNLQRERFGAALALCVAAAAIHLRAVALLPIAIAALVGLLRTRRSRAWIHPATIAGILVAAIDVWVFVEIRPFAADFRQQTTALVSQLSVGLAVCVGLSAMAAGLCVGCRQWVAAGTVALVLVLAVVDLRAWWHAGLALIPLLLAASPTGPRLLHLPVRRRMLSLLASVVLVVWAVQVQHFAWGGRAWDLPRKIAHSLTAGAVNLDP